VRTRSGLGASGSLDFKISSFGNRLSAAIPLLGADFNGAIRKMTLSFGGGLMAMPF
jgi:hypothetical protein